MCTNEITRLTATIPVNNSKGWNSVQLVGVKWLDETKKPFLLDGNIRFVFAEELKERFPEWFRNRRKTKALLRTLATPTGFSGCILWSGTTEGKGYAPAKIRYEMFELAYGEVPKGMDYQLDHLCDTPLCINGLHMMLTRREENDERAGTNKKLASCRKKNHPFDPATDRYDKHGNRRCGVCYAEYLEEKRNGTYKPEGKRKRGDDVACGRGHSREEFGRRAAVTNHWVCKKCHAEAVRRGMEKYNEKEAVILDGDLFAELEVAVAA